MAQLRGPGGCPWDHEQTHASLRGSVLEEAYEVAAAIESADDANLREELGDLLLQVVFHSQIAAEEGRFTLDDVARGIGEKLVRRHPHVFGAENGGDAGRAGAVGRNQARGKTRSAAPHSLLDGITGRSARAAARGKGAKEGRKSGVRLDRDAIP